MVKDMDSKALEKAAQDYELYHDVDDSQPYLFTIRGDIAEAFKAGARWQAKRGVSFDDIILKEGAYPGNPSIPSIKDYIIPIHDNTNFKVGDRVNVQITKID